MTKHDRNSPHLEQLEAQLEEWVDGRIVSRDMVSVWYRFHEYLVNLAEADGWQYDGHSLKVALPMSTLVVRGTVDGVAHVVFSSGKTTTDCMRAFLRKLEEGWLEWQKDRFR